MEIIKSKKLYLLIIGTLFISSYLLNQATEIYKCSAIYTLIFVVSRVAQVTYGKTRAIYALIASLTGSILFLGKLTYFINHKAISGLVIASFIAVTTSILFSIITVERLQNKHQLLSIKVNLISLLVAAITDGIIMGTFFTFNSVLNYTDIMNIFIKETLYKILYGCVTYILIRVMFETSVKGNMLLKQHGSV